MKIKINLDKVGKTVKEDCEGKLEKNNLPTCMGNMTLPILKNTVILDSNDYDIIKLKKGIDAPLQIERGDIVTSLGNDESLEDFCLDKESLTVIQEIKDERIDKYIDVVTKCSKCKVRDLCYQLTSNYLLSLSLLMNNTNKL